MISSADHPYIPVCAINSGTTILQMPLGVEAVTIWTTIVPFPYAHTHTHSRINSNGISRQHVVFQTPPGWFVAKWDLYSNMSMRTITTTHHQMHLSANLVVSAFGRRGKMTWWILICQLIEQKFKKIMPTLSGCAAASDPITWHFL